MIRKIKFRGIVIVLLVLIAGYYYQTATLSFKPGLDFLDVPKLLGYLLLLALFVERSIEFILSLWRSADADRMDRQLGKLKEEITWVQGVTPTEKKRRNDLFNELEQARDQRSEYRTNTRFAALWTGFVIGVVLAFAGVRVLGTIFTDAGLAEAQLKIFILVDILFTGFILAGGSEGIHKIMKVYSSFTARVEARNKAAGEKG